MAGMAPGAVISPAGAASGLPRTPAGPLPPAAALKVYLTPGSNAFHMLGTYAYCAYLFSGYANDLSLRLLGGKAYLSWLAGILLIVSWLCCGTPVRGANSRVGKAWLGILLCMLISTPFSTWRGESIDLLKTYVPRQMGLFFYCTAFAITLKHCRILMIGHICATCAVLLAATLFGAAPSGRFCIPDSMFFSGANELALALVSSLGFTLYLIFQKSWGSQILGGGMFLLSVLYILKTGSRGSFLALGLCLILLFIFSSSRGKLAALSLPAVALLFMLPGSIMTRLVEIILPDNLSAANANNEATESQLERTMLLRKSVEFAITHPLLGVGPGTFTNALYLNDLANKTHTHALGTHNSYTQIASECGMPVLLLYLGVIIGSMTSNFRIMRKTRGRPGAERVFTMAICLFASLAAYALASAFHHVAYTETLPTLSGFSAALAMASRHGDVEWIGAENAAGNA